MLHDFVLVPLTLLLGLALVRLLPANLRAPVAGGLVVLGTVTLMAVPVLGGWGANADNPTILDRNYPVGWLVVAGVTIAGGRADDRAEQLGGGPVARVLVVDDDPTVREVVVSYLRAAGHQVDETGDGESVAALMRDDPADLVVLDLMLPGIDGLEVCRRLRASSDVPVIMLTALGTETDRVVGLELGADDYVTKPFSPRELVLRVESVLRRAGERTKAEEGRLEDGDLVVDLGRHEATLGDRVLALTSREYDLLQFLVSHPGTAFSREELLQQVWGWSFGDQSTVTVHVRRLREKVEVDPTMPERLVTVWGVGYRWEAR